MLKPTMEETIDGVSSEVESSLYNNVHSILRELESKAGVTANKGMLRWTLHNRVERNPAVSVPLLRLLVKELEKAERIDSRIRIVPLLHTLVYTLLQSAFIPKDLNRRICLSLKRLVTLPVPYSTIALSYARQMKVEQRAPGMLYQKRVVSEHNLLSDPYPLNEKVFVFVDAAVLPPALLSALRADVECVDGNVELLLFKRKVLLHTLQAGLGKHCHPEQLLCRLENLGEELELHFQNLISVSEQRAEDPASDENQYKTRLQEIYQDILTTAAKDPAHPSSRVETLLPAPEVSFHVWAKEEDIFERNSTYLEEDELKRDSVMSTDSGIEGDLPISGFSFMMLDTEEQSHQQSFYRRPCVRWPKSGNRNTLMMEAIKGNGGLVLMKEAKNLTARIVVMGDDRTLGKLAKTLHSIRKREARHLLLTKKVHLEMFYIPLTEQQPIGQEAVPEDMLTLAGYLGRVDPWYDSNINPLRNMIIKLAQMSSQSDSSQPNTFLLDIISYYTRLGQYPVHLPVYSIKICFSGLRSAAVEEVFVAQLSLDFPEVKHYQATLRNTFRGSVHYYKTNPQERQGTVVSVNYRKASLCDREEEREMSVSTNAMFTQCNDKFPREQSHQSEHTLKFPLAWIQVIPNSRALNTNTVWKKENR
ncbi:hypothetical protein DNTS_018800 [Danionella cerebrum]|uniref:Phosphoinositide 3-kinase regulatory subunit 6 n=1 Tax=Danionella cerebrum TaxID=2873325 RepID=A0A553QN74_9TELE|nr:hypothetical protein DNTS_018800 [Danionella translucida]